MTIDKDTAGRVARLARISIPETELESLASELSDIVGFMEQLNECDVTNIEPMTSVTPTLLKQRMDLIDDGDQQKMILSNAPDSREGFFAVPKVVE
ncbi:MAG: Asp-tRNA(Asn)/Glu-tRNA(Gln) amidotransferase subunit GatC [Paracoccaceae bacterium]|jgi:aspartyl-tRNA(Asn)/glutamyl-tRNA(Gln) amidotransferase subunit C|nr:Asp-tRNA(Asn)/Glu-tRNA(Gln) amidotransferase subunit GatC [Paracoccaceae bacterium]|tara:strand:+ start:381 stop:668 length:288 start_codon:yes stop_codon:yes gene_type:complete